MCEAIRRAQWFATRPGFREWNQGDAPFLSSTVTVSFWHFMRKLDRMLVASWLKLRGFTHRTSFMLADSIPAQLLQAFN